MSPIFRKLLAFIVAAAVTIGFIFLFPVPESALGPNGELPATGTGNAITVLLVGSVAYFLALQGIGLLFRASEPSRVSAADDTTEKED